MRLSERQNERLAAVATAGVAAGVYVGNQARLKKGTLADEAAFRGVRLCGYFTEETSHRILTWLSWLARTLMSCLNTIGVVIGALLLTYAILLYLTSSWWHTRIEWINRGVNSEQGTALVGRGGVFHVMRTSPNVSDALYAVGNSELLASNESRSLVNAFAYILHEDQLHDPKQMAKRNPKLADGLVMLAPVANRFCGMSDATVDPFKSTWQNFRESCSGVIQGIRYTSLAAQGYETAIEELGLDGIANITTAFGKFMERLEAANPTQSVVTVSLNPSVATPQSVEDANALFGKAQSFSQALKESQAKVERMCDDVLSIGPAMSTICEYALDTYPCFGSDPTPEQKEFCLRDAEAIIGEAATRLLPAANALYHDWLVPVLLKLYHVFASATRDISQSWPWDPSFDYKYLRFSAVDWMQDAIYYEPPPGEHFAVVDHVERMRAQSQDLRLMLLQLLIAVVLVLLGSVLNKLLFSEYDDHIYLRTLAKTWEAMQRALERDQLMVQDLAEGDGSKFLGLVDKRCHNAASAIQKVARGFTTRKNRE